MNNIDFTQLKIASYNRKSSEAEDKQMLSIDSQLDEATRIKEFYNLAPFVAVLKESKSAKTEYLRPEFTRMMNMIKSGKIDAIVCWKLDRLARNMTEGGQLIDLLSSGVLKAILTHDKVFYPWDNVIVMSVEFSQGKQYVKELSVNVRRGQEKKARMGLPHGIAPLGYLNDKTQEKGNRTWIVDTERLDKLKILFDRYLTGTYSAGQLHKYAIEELKLTTVPRTKYGGLLIARSKIYKMLVDPIYAGFFYYNNQRYELAKNFPRLITEIQHEKVKQLLTGKNIPKIQKHITLYAGFISSNEGNFMGQDVKYHLVCDCKRKFSYQNKTTCPYCHREIANLVSPIYRTYTFYYNVKKKKAGVPYKHISDAVITKQFAKFINDNLLFSDDLVEWFRLYVNEMKDNEFTTALKRQQFKETRRAEFEKKKGRLREILRDTTITKEEYAEDLEKLTNEYADINKDTKDIDWYGQMLEILDLTKELATLFDKGDVDAQRRLLSRLGSNLIWDDKNLCITSKNSIQKLVDGIQAIKSDFPEFEPKNFLTDKALNDKTDRLSPAMSRMLDTWNNVRLAIIEESLGYLTK